MPVKKKPTARAVSNPKASKRRVGTQASKRKASIARAAKPASKPTGPRKSLPKSGDDLTRIEGIGPAIQAKLKAAGITTFKKLASTSDRRLKAILSDAGPGFRMHNPSTWREQAKLASSDKWDELKRLQDKLNRRSKSIHVDTDPTAVVAFSHVNGGSYQPGQPYKIERLLEPAEAAAEHIARLDELEPEFVRARKAIRKFLKEPDIKKAIDKGHITGVSARFRTKFGHEVSPLQVVIVVNVAKKLPMETLKKCCLEPITPIYNGIRVKVVEGTFHLITKKGFFLTGQANPQSPLDFSTAISGGIPIAPSGDLDDFGTLTLVTDIIEGGKQKFIGITCNHVVKSDNAKIHQLGKKTSRNRHIANVKMTIPPKDRNATKEESVDCAYVVPLSGNTNFSLPPSGVWARGLSHSINESPDASTKTEILIASRKVNPHDVGFELWKFGSGLGTLIQDGIICNYEEEVYEIDGNKFYGNFSVSLRNKNAALATGGDSGSLLAIRAKVNNKIVFVAVGILFALLENKTVGLACNMSEVIKALKLEIPKDRLVEGWDLPS
jgi:predicted flap endonuclease-1-like 5' DNA nuclease